MTRITIALLLAFVSVAQSAEPAPAKPATTQAAITGSYAIATMILTFNADGTITFQQVSPILVSISGPNPPPVPPVPVSDLRAKLAAEVAKITAADKITTASTLNQALTATVAPARSGQVTAANVGMVLGLLGPTMPAWSAFISVLNDAVKLTTAPTGLGDVLQIAVDELTKVK